MLFAASLFVIGCEKENENSNSATQQNGSTQQQNDTTQIRSLSGTTWRSNDQNVTYGRFVFATSAAGECFLTNGSGTARFTYTWEAPNGTMIIIDGDVSKNYTFVIEGNAMALYYEGNLIGVYYKVNNGGNDNGGGNGGNDNGGGNGGNDNGGGNGGNDNGGGNGGNDNGGGNGGNDNGGGNGGNDNGGGNGGNDNGGGNGGNDNGGGYGGNSDNSPLRLVFDGTTTSTFGYMSNLYMYKDDTTLLRTRAAANWVGGAITLPYFNCMLKYVNDERSPWSVESIEYGDNVNEVNAIIQYFDDGQVTGNWFFYSLLNGSEINDFDATNVTISYTLYAQMYNAYEYFIEEKDDVSIKTLEIHANNLRFTRADSKGDFFKSKGRMKK